MRILLIAPRSDFPDTTPGWLRVPQMTLLILEALTPAPHHVTLVEEEADPIPWDEAWDLVGITVMTATAPHSYLLAGKFRERGSRVVLGGIHATIMPEEASLHADAVVVGEAEGVWERVLDDACKGALQPIYRNMTPDIGKVPLVRYPDPERRSRLIPSVAPVVSTRGCANGCEFCSVPEIYGRRPRRLPVERVIAQIGRSGTDYLNFLDDNLVADRRWALELFSRMRPFRRKWIASFPLRCVLDDEIWSAARAAGLKGIFAGVETIEEKSMARFSKVVPIGDTIKAIRRCRESGVMLNASFIFGLDEHDATIFDRTREFIMEHKVASISACILTPHPGTAVYRRMLAGNRLLHRNWSYYDHITPVFRPASMSAAELAERYMQFRKEVFGLESICRRLLPHVAVAPRIYVGLNMAFRRTTTLLEEHYRRYFRWLEEETPSVTAGDPAWPRTDSP